MRNLKKVLALVLALVMALGLMSVASAKSAFDDADSITAEYSEAVEVLNALGIFRGKNSTTTFAPGDTISRAEVAAVIYRIDTKDVKDTKSGSYVGTKFGDVADDHWANGYIGYCDGSQLVKGRGGNIFDPDAAVTGYEVLAMILRVVGYEGLDGDDWQIKVAQRAEQLGITKTITNANVLREPASRELVAELLFRTLTEAEVVYKNALWEYRTTHDLQPGSHAYSNYWSKDLTLGEFKFGLYPGATYTIDKWGRPGYDWNVGGEFRFTAWANDNETNDGWKQTLGGTKLVTIEETPVLKFQTAKTECAVVDELAALTTENATLAGDYVYSLYLNGSARDISNYTINALDTTTKVGAIGRQTEIYDSGRVVMIDTFLAVVTSAADATYDPSGHVRTPANVTLHVYDAGNKGTKDAPAADPGTGYYTDLSIAACSGTAGYVLTDVTRTLATYKYQDGSEAKVGDMVLLNAYTGDYDELRVDWDDNKQEAAYTSYRVENTPADRYGVILQVAKNTVAKQSKWTYNTQSHYVGSDTATPDNAELHVDQAGTNTTLDHVWYFDQFGNVIGIFDVASNVIYGRMTGLVWKYGTDDDNPFTTGTGYAYVEVTDFEGVKHQVAVSEIVIQSDDGSGDDDGTPDAAMLQLTSMKTDTDTTVALVPVYGDNTDAMKTGPFSGAVKSAYAQETFDLFVTANNATNAAAQETWADNNDPAKTFVQYAQIFDNQMFKFVQNASGTSYRALEVAGNADNGADFQGNFSGDQIRKNALTSGAIPAGDLYTTTDGLTSMSSRTFRYNVASQTDGSQWLQMTGTTKIALLSGIDTAAEKVTYYTGYQSMPDIKHVKEIDWADADGDGWADYVFIIGELSNSITHNLFYYRNGMPAYESNNTGGRTYIVHGYLDGVEQDVEMSADAYQAVVAKGSTDFMYTGMLYGLRMVDNIATGVFTEDEYNAGNGGAAGGADDKAYGLTASYKNNPTTYEVDNTNDSVVLDDIILADDTAFDVISDTNPHASIYAAGTTVYGVDALFYATNAGPREQNYIYLTLAQNGDRYTGTYLFHHDADTADGAVDWEESLTFDSNITKLIGEPTWGDIAASPYTYNMIFVVDAASNVILQAYAVARPGADQGVSASYFIDGSGEIVKNATSKRVDVNFTLDVALGTGRAVDITLYKLVGGVSTEVSGLTVHSSTNVGSAYTYTLKTLPSDGEQVLRAVITLTNTAGTVVYDTLDTGWWTVDIET